jgi:hypothetical protein
MAKLDLLSFLVEETFKLQRSGESELSSFELKLNDYGLDYLKGEFIPQIQMLRFELSDQLLDVPINWSLFSLEEGQEHVVLEEDHDPEHLFEILTSLWRGPVQKMLITHADGFCYVVGLRSGELNHLNDLLKRQEWLKAG